MADGKVRRVYDSGQPYKFSQIRLGPRPNSQLTLDGIPGTCWVPPLNQFGQHMHPTWDGCSVFEKLWREPQTEQNQQTRDATEKMPTRKRKSRVQRISMQRLISLHSEMGEQTAEYYAACRSTLVLGGECTERQVIILFMLGVGTSVKSPSSSSVDTSWNRTGNEWGSINTKRAHKCARSTLAVDLGWWSHVLLIPCWSHVVDHMLLIPCVGSHDPMLLIPCWSHVLSSTVFVGDMFKLQPYVDIPMYRTK